MIFGGKLNRKQFLQLTLPTFLGALILINIGAIVQQDFNQNLIALSILSGFLIWIFVIPVMLAKRIRDAGMSGKWALLWFIPLAGLAVFFIFGFMPGKENERKSDNKYNIDFENLN